MTKERVGKYDSAINETVELLANEKNFFKKIGILGRFIQIERDILPDVLLGDLTRNEELEVREKLAAAVSPDKFSLKKQD